MINLRNEFNEFIARPMIDAEIANLSKLVSGQKSVKKKKTKKTPFRPMSYQQRPNNFLTKKNYFPQANSQFRFSPQNNNNSYNNHCTRSTNNSPALEVQMNYSI